MGSRVENPEPALALVWSWGARLSVRISGFYEPDIEGEDYAPAKTAPAAQPGHQAAGTWQIYEDARLEADRTTFVCLRS